jgi:hypothetical protein
MTMPDWPEKRVQQPLFGLKMNWQREEGATFFAPSNLCQTAWEGSRIVSLKNSQDLLTD